MTPPADAPRIRPEEKVALVLGAGGARGLAQIGVIEALEARGIHIVAIAGSSSGALVGGLHASGKLPAYRDWLLTLDRRAMLRLLDPGFGRSALFEGARLIEALREIAGSPRIEDLPIDFTAVAVDVMRQREVWLREGDMWDAIRASFAIPGLFTPHMIHGRALVDGGLLAPLPIAATRLSDAHRLIAVDMHGWPQRPPGEPAQEGAPSGDMPKSGALVVPRVVAQRRCDVDGGRRALAPGLHGPDGAFARPDAGADLARAAGAGSAGAGDPHSAGCVPVLRILAGEGIDRGGAAGSGQGARRGRVLSSSQGRSP